MNLWRHSIRSTRKSSCGRLKRSTARAGITVIVNLHALDLARRYCTRIIGMSSGRLVFDGLTSELTTEAAAQIYAREEFTRPALQQNLTEFAA